MTNPSISIVIPVYKPREEYLRALFDSIARQTFQDFEIIISDDASTEELIRHALPTSIKDRTVYVQNQSKKGIFGNLNNGLRHASGNCIQLFCQDDIMLPDLLRANNHALIQNPEIDIVFSRFDEVSEDGVVSVVQRKEFDYIPSYLSAAEANNFFLYFGCIPGNLSPVMIRKSLFSKVGYFDHQFKFVGDFDFWIRSSAHTGFIWIKQTHLLVRNHAQRAGLTLGTVLRFTELKIISNYLMNHNSLPFSPSIIRRYLHIHLFRSVMIYGLRYLLFLKPQFWKSIRNIFDNNPFSIRLAWLSFLRPIPKDCIPLKNLMEIRRS